MKFFTIDKGRHRPSKRKLGLTFNEMIKYRVRFNYTAIYKTAWEGNQGDINKLFGVSDQWSHHHKNSARFGWRYVLNGGLEIFAYLYVDGIRITKYICTIGIDRPIEFTIHMDKEGYSFIVKDRNNTYTVGHKRKRCTISLKYLLGLYFGGNETAPQTITVEMQRL